MYQATGDGALVVKLSAELWLLRGVAGTAAPEHQDGPAGAADAVVGERGPDAETRSRA
jgi:hypothetical protein